MAPIGGGATGAGTEPDRTQSAAPGLYSLPQSTLPASPPSLQVLSRALRTCLHQPVHRLPDLCSTAAISLHSPQHTVWTLPGSSAPSSLPPISGTRPQHWLPAPAQAPLDVSTVSSHGCGTHGQMYTGHASKQWLHSEVERDVDDLAAAVDRNTMARETKMFVAERKALQAELKAAHQAHAACEEKLRKAEAMLPNDKGEFTWLRKEVEELELDVEFYAELSEQEEAARKRAQRTIRDTIDFIKHSIAHIDGIDNELQQFKKFIDSIPQQPPPDIPQLDSKEGATDSSKAVQEDKQGRHGFLGHCFGRCCTA